MRDIEFLLKKYLGRQTQYAINIIGPWGRGKTHYYKNVLHKLISETSTPSDERIKYKPVYISLFGLNSVDEIQIKILNELLYQQFTPKKKWFHRVRRKKIKLTVKLVKLIIKGFLTFKGWKGTYEFGPRIVDFAKDAIDTNQLLICFDDLERKSPKLLMEDFTGYLNTLVEENVKVLVICNEPEIQDENYRLYKEKIIDTTYEYRPETSSVIANIISSRYAGSPSYISFLQTIKHLLLEIVELNSYNYRHLIYSLDSLHDVYSILKTYVLDSRQDWAEKCNEELENITLFTLSVSTEFKASRLSFSDRTAFINGHSIATLRGLYDLNRTNKSTLEEDNQFEQFIKKYYGDVKSYKHYNSIFDLVTGAKEFDVNIFETEFKKIHHLQMGLVLPEYQILKDLAYYDCLTLTDEEYRVKTLQMIAYAKAGHYKLTEYMTVYYYVSRFDNLLDISLDDLVVTLKAAMSRIAEDAQALADQAASRFDFEHNISKDEAVEEIRKHGLLIFLEQANKKEDAEIINLIYYITKGIDKLHNKYHEKGDFKYRFNTTPILESVDADMFADSLFHANPFAIQFMESLLTSRYPHISYNKEGMTLYLLKERIVKYLAENPQKTLSNYALKSLHTTILQIEDKHGLPSIA